MFFGGDDLTRSIADALLELKEFGEVLLQRRLSGVDVNIHVAGRILRHGVNLVVSPRWHLPTHTHLWVT